VPNKQGEAVERQAAVNADVDAEGFVVCGMLREGKLGTEGIGETEGFNEGLNWTAGESRAS
jgi:hypothetical protein